jgi:hypothetical protein
MGSVHIGYNAYTLYVCTASVTKILFLYGTFSAVFSILKHVLHEFFSYVFALGRMFILLITVNFAE